MSRPIQTKQHLDALMRSRSTVQMIYQDRRNEIRTEIAKLESILRVHARKAKGAPGNWGYANDLASIREDLQSITSRFEAILQ